MRVWEIRGKFGLDSLTEAERPTPKPGPREVLVRMRAASLNYRDLLMVQGKYNPRQPLPLIPLSDGVGEVVELGAGASRFKTGERVAGAFAQRWISGEPTREKLGSTLGGPVEGVLCGFKTFDEEGLVRVPEHLTDEEAAALPCAGVTAWSAFAQRPLRAGDTVLIQGTGGVSMFALQFAHAMGARVIVTSSSDEKLAKARALGASEVINYSTTLEWGKQARELSGGAGVDHVVEVGGAGTFQQSLRAVRPGGQISLIGVLSGASVEISLNLILMQNVRVQGVLVGSRETFEAMNRAIAFHELRPQVSRIFAFSEIRPALEHLASGSHFGKICLRA